MRLSRAPPPRQPILFPENSDVATTIRLRLAFAAGVFVKKLYALFYLGPVSAGTIQADGTFNDWYGQAESEAFRYGLGFNVLEAPAQEEIAAQVFISPDHNSENILRSWNDATYTAGLYALILPAPVPI